jgi:hypothetical protein
MDREKEYFLRGIFESVIITSYHPRTSISIIIQVVQDDGAISHQFFFSFSFVVSFLYFLLLTMNNA